MDDLNHGRQRRKVCRRSSARYLLGFGAQACRSDAGALIGIPPFARRGSIAPAANGGMPLARRRSRPSVHATETDRDGSDQLRAALFVDVAGVGAASLRRPSIRGITRGSKAVAIMAWPSRVRWMKSRV